MKKFKQHKIYSSFRYRDNIWAVDLRDMQLVSKFNKEIRFLSCVIDVKSSIYFDFDIKNDDKDAKFKVGNYVKI